MPHFPPRCQAPHPFVPAITCGLPAEHGGDHAGRAYWSPPGEEGPPTVRLPPLRDTVRRRPPVPGELTRAELIRALIAELEQDLAAEDDAQ